VVHHSCYQRTKAEVVHQQGVNSRNGSKGGRRPRPGRERMPAAGPVDESPRELSSDPVTHSPSEPRAKPSTESVTEMDGTGRDRTQLQDGDMRMASSGNACRTPECTDDVQDQPGQQLACIPCQRALVFRSPCPVHGPASA
jgi:hypothetical protein